MIEQTFRARRCPICGERMEEGYTGYYCSNCQRYMPFEE